MARIIGGIGASHAPSMAHAYDKKDAREDAIWRPLFEGFDPAKAWLEAAKPDLIITVYNDHMDRFFFDAYPTFALGVGAELPGADEGWGKRPLPDFAGNPEFARHALRSLIDDEFDITVCHEMTIDHGILSVMPYLADPPWPAPILPLAVNVIHHPVPKPVRLFKLGRALRRAVESYPEDLRVVVLATGGLSHQLHGSNFGLMNPDWDNRFLDLLESDPGRLAEYSHDQYMEWGGAESVEMIMWLAMRAAMGEQVRRAYRFYYAPMLTGYGLVVFESDEESGNS